MLGALKEQSQVVLLIFQLLLTPRTFCFSGWQESRGPGEFSGQQPPRSLESGAGFRPWSVARHC